MQINIDFVCVTDKGVVWCEWYIGEMYQFENNTKTKITINFIWMGNEEDV